MGLGTKIKDALHGDHRDNTTSDVKAPGAYPKDELPQRHSDGREYTPPHGSLVNKKKNTSDPAGTSDFSSAGKGSTSTTGPGDDLISSSGTQRNKLHRDTDNYHPTQDSYSQSTYGHHPQNSGVGLGQQASAKDHAPQGAYWGDLSHEGHHDDSLTGDLPDRTSRGHELPGFGKSNHSPHFAEQAVGGGAHESMTGAGSPDRTGGAVHDPLTSSTGGTSLPPSNKYDQRTDYQGRGNQTTGGGQTGPRAPAGAGAGAATGYGVSEYAPWGHHRSSRESAHRDDYAPGVPRTSMLEPEAGVSSSATQQNHQAPGAAPTAQHHLGNTSTATQSGTAGASGLGRDHYGPAHEGAKVLHTCQHCGQDNDISQYFRKEAVYRLES